MRTQIPGKQILDSDIDTVDIKDGAVTDPKLSSTGVTAGDYSKVTVNEKGRVTGGVNPTTLAGYGITDAVSIASRNSVITVVDEPDRPAARRLTVSDNQILKTDSGEGGTLNLGIAPNPILPGTQSVTVPVGTTAQRPAVPTSGMLRVNSTTADLETYASGVWDSVVLSTDKRLGDSQMLQVKKQPGDGEFSSVAAAMNSITDASVTKPYTLMVGPGVFEEPTIVFKSYVEIHGAGMESTIIRAQSANMNLIEGAQRASVYFCTLEGSTADGFSAVHFDDPAPNITVTFNVIGCRFGSNHIHVLCESGYTSVDGCLFGSLGPFDHGFICRDNGQVARVLLRNTTTTGAAGIQGLSPKSIYSCHGTKSVMYMFSLSARYSGTTPDANSVGVHVSNGGSVVILTTNIERWGKGLWVENVGAAPYLEIVGLNLQNNVLDMVIDHPGTTGNFTGNAAKSKSSVADGVNCTIFFNDYLSKGVATIGPLFLGDKQSNLTDFAPLLMKTGAVGVLEGGQITAHPTLPATVIVAAGAGYLKDPTSGTLKYVQWPTQNVTLVDNASNTVWVDTNSVIYANPVPPDPFANVMLGGAMSYQGLVAFLARTATQTENAFTHVDDYLSTAIGPIFSSGSQVSENETTPFHLDVSSGVYWVSINRFQPSGGNDIVFLNFYPDGSFAPDQVVSNTMRGDLTTSSLVPITTGKYIKHALYLFEDGADETYGLVFGQDEFDTEAEAEAGPLPLPPPYFVAPVVVIAGIVVQEGATAITTIQDVRPRLGFTAAATSSTSDHGNLVGLLDDDHQQYLLTNGTRALTGTLDMNGHAILNVHSIDGVDVHEHAARHLPNGVDPISTAAPTTGLTSTTLNAEGIANSLARSDHTHAITGFQPLHPELTALTEFETIGFAAHTHDGTGEHTWEARSIVGAGGRIAVTNGNGDDGNPTIDLATVGTAGTYTTLTTDAFGRVVSGTHTMDWMSLTDTPTTLSGYGILDAQALNANLTSISGLSTNGIVVIGPSGTATARSLIGPAAGIVVTNGSGVAGNPTLSLGNDLGAVEALTTTGFAVRTGADTWVTRTFSTPGSGVNISNGSGGAGDLVISIVNDLAAIEALTTTGITVRTGNETWATRALAGTTGNIVVSNASGLLADPTINLATAGTAGTYQMVTTDAYGRVVAGTNPTTINGYGITDAVSTTLLGANNGVATLDSSGKLNSSQIPALSITDTFVVASQSAMLSLTAQVGDVAVRTDLNKSYILRVAGANTLANWQELLTPTDSVLSVNGQTGVVSINTGVMSVAVAAPVSGLTVSGTPITTSGTLTFALANDLAALEGLGTTGMAVRTALDTWTTRAITSGSGISVTNGDGISGAPTINLATTGTAGTYRSVTTDGFGRVTAGTNPTTLAGYGITDAQPLDAELTALSTNTGTGLYAITSAGASTTRTITAASTRVSVVNGNGVAGNPTVDVVEANLVLNNVGGVLGTAKGGTNLSTIGAANTVLGVNTGATGLEYKSLSGTTNQIVITPAAGNVVFSLAPNTVIPGTTGVVVPAGTTAQRAVTPTAGTIRLNTTSTNMEAYNGTSWQPITSPNSLVQYFRGTVAPTLGTSIIPYGTVAPTSAQGTLLLSQTITPLDAQSYVEIQFSGIGDLSNTSSYLILSLFRGTTFIGMSIMASGKQGADFTNTLVINVIDMPNTTSPVTYSVRVGASSGTWYFGRGQNATFGNAALSHWSIKEYS